VSIDDYVTEDGSRSLRDAYVRDLLPASGVPVKLLLIFESPHLEEVAAGTPVVGGAGQSALEYLLGNATRGSLGEFVDAMHTAGDYRVTPTVIVLEVTGSGAPRWSEVTHRCTPNHATPPLVRERCFELGPSLTSPTVASRTSMPGHRQHEKSSR
jgi:hypothetical protein